MSYVFKCVTTTKIVLFSIENIKKQTKYAWYIDYY